MINKFNIFKNSLLRTVPKFFPIFVLILSQQNLNIQINIQINILSVVFLFYPLIFSQNFHISFFLNHRLKNDKKYILKVLLATIKAINAFFQELKNVQK